MKGSSEIEPCSSNILRIVITENEPEHGLGEEAGEVEGKPGVCDSWKQSEEGF